MRSTGLWEALAYTLPHQQQKPDSDEQQAD
jgi:hypothetical protein